MGRFELLTISFHLRNVLFPQNLFTNTKKLSVTKSVVLLWSLAMEMSCLEEISFSLYMLLVNLAQPHN